MGAVMSLRSEYKDAFEKKHAGVRLGFMSFFVRACVAALHEYPAVNAEIDGEDIVYKNYVNMGIAVGGANGLVVPVLRDAQDMSFAQIEGAIAGLGKRARDGQLKLEELAGGTFSITNGGTYGSLMHADPQPAAIGDPGHAQDPGPADGGVGKDRDTADDVSGFVVRPPDHRRQGSGELPGAGEGGDRGSTAVAVGAVRKAFFLERKNQRTFVCSLSPRSFVSWRVASAAFVIAPSVFCLARAAVPFAGDLPPGASQSVVEVHTIARSYHGPASRVQGSC